MEAPSVEGGGGRVGYEKKRFDDAPTALPTAAEMLVARAMSRRKSDGPAGRKEHRV